MLKQSAWINSLLEETEKNPTEDKILQLIFCGECQPYIFLAAHEPPII